MTACNMRLNGQTHYCKKGRCKACDIEQTKGLGFIFEDNPGCRISISRDKEDNQVWIYIRDQDGSTILKCQKQLWDGTGGIGFTPLIRDNIMSEVRRLFR